MIGAVLCGVLTAVVSMWLASKLVPPYPRPDTSLEMTEEERERYDRRVAKLPLDDGDGRP